MTKKDINENLLQDSLKNGAYSTHFLRKLHFGYSTFFKEVQF